MKLYVETRWNRLNSKQRRRLLEGLSVDAGDKNHEGFPDCIFSMWPQVPSYLKEIVAQRILASD